MSIEAYRLLDDEITRRDNPVSAAMDNALAGIYEGELPAEYDKFFPTNSPKQIVNMTRLAWDDLATQVGRLPDLRSDPENNSNAAEKRASLHEKIGFGYLRSAEPSGKIAMFMNAWWLIGIGRSIMIVRPDEKQQQPIISIRDPRTCYPGARRTAGHQIVELSDLMFKYELPVDEMERRGLAQSGNTFISPGGDRTGTVIEFIDDKRWMIVSDGGTVQQAEHNLGVVPGWVFQTFSPNKTTGLSQFQDQITFMVAISRMLSQKLRYADRLAHPITWVKGHEGTLQLGPDVLNKLSPQGEMGQLAPPVQLQVDRDIELLTRFSRILNRNPESRQGEVQSKGAYTSAKTLEQLAEAIDTVVGRQWDIVSVGMNHIMSLCYAMDEKMWPNVEKQTKGIIKNTAFRESYIPAEDIDGQWDINVDYGFGVGGYQGFLMQLQSLEAGLNSKRRAAEQMPGVSDVDDLMREIELEAMDDGLMANFQAQAAQGALDMVLWMRIRKQMAKKGTPLVDAIEKYEDELKAQAQAALQQGGAAPVTAAPIPEEAPPEEAPALPGIPPSAALGM